MPDDLNIFAIRDVKIRWLLLAAGILSLLSSSYFFFGFASSDEQNVEVLPASKVWDFNSKDIDLHDLPTPSIVQRDVLDNTGKWAGGDVQELIKQSYHVRCSTVDPSLVLSFRVWPIPKVFCTGQTRRTVCPSLKLKFYKAEDQDMEDSLRALVVEAFDRAIKNAFLHTWENYNAKVCGQIRTVNFKVLNTSSELQLGVDESYTMQIDGSDGDVWITAITVFGVLHAFETLSQVIDFDFDKGYYVIPDAPLLIDDAPRFAHRGIMIDTARHYFSVRTIKNLVESMAYAKFNVLHWHLYDRESFPFRPVSHPELSRARFSMFEEYTVGDIREIVRFSKARGIRVYIELDMPGHADSWCVSHPELCPSEGCRSPLNVLKVETLTIMSDLIKDLTSKEAGVLKDRFIHLGFDEVRDNCWRESSTIMDWIRAKGTNTNKLIADFLETISTTINKTHTSVVWGDAWDIMNDARVAIPESMIFQVWLWGNLHNPGTPGQCAGCRTPEIVQAGHRVIWSRNDYWYLDHLHKD